MGILGFWVELKGPTYSLRFCKGDTTILIVMYKGVNCIELIFKRNVYFLYTSGIYHIRIFASVLFINYFSDTQKYNYVILLTGVLLLSIVGSFILRKGSLYLEKLNEKNAFSF